MGYPKQITVDEIHEKRNHPDNSLAVFDRDMTRLLDLRNHYDNPGLNSPEHREAMDLLDKYEIDHLKWSRRTMFGDGN